LRVAEVGSRGGGLKKLHELNGLHGYKGYRRSSPM
jgi:hypothetical protein